MNVKESKINKIVSPFFSLDLIFLWLADARRLTIRCDTRSLSLSLSFVMGSSFVVVVDVVVVLVFLGYAPESATAPASLPRCKTRMSQSVKSVS